MKVMVTGGAGFIGSHLVDALVDDGYDVVVLDNLNTGKIENINPEATFYLGDLMEEDALSHCLRKERPKVIFHLAAQVSASKSLANPRKDAEINVLGSVNVLEAARTAGVKKVVYASSAAVYGSPRYLPVDPLHPVEPLSFYGLSKYTVERYLSVYAGLYDLDYTVLRYANVYGSRQDASGEGGVVAIFIDQLRKGQQPVIYGDGQQTRDFIHVSDVVKANLCAITRGSKATFNIGTSQPVTVNELFEKVKDLISYDGQPQYQPPRIGDIRDSCLMDDRAAVDLGWIASTDLLDGLKQTVFQVR